MSQSGTRFGGRGSHRWLVAVVTLVGFAWPVSAQFIGRAPAAGAPRSLAPPAAGPRSVSPGPGFGSPGASMAAPGFGSGAIGIAPPRGDIPSILPAAPGLSGTGVPQLAPGQVGLLLSARFGEKTGPITGGLHWRIYAERPDNAGRFQLLKEDRSAAPTFVLPPGGYVVHVNVGLASATKHVRLRAETVRELLDIPAGGIRLEGRVGGVRIPAGQISFDVFPGSQFDSGDKRPITRAVMTGDVVMVTEGTYHIVSNYGDANAVIRSDIRIQSGKLTDVTVTHHAAIITLKLVGDRGGEALANTAWSVLTPGGDVVKESIGAFPRVILAEGDYRVIARNEGKVFERAFKVSSGVDGEIEVLAR
ncbi:MAG: hypothetical protein GEU91_08095 [Rhizobiales bacterium]|nr:hypothetical protein [Hyphomicrobiales bacterium]